MSPVGGNDAGWLKQNYEKVILIVILVGLMASASYLMIRIGQVKNTLAARDGVTDHVVKQEVEPVEAAAWSNRMASFQKPFQSGSFPNQMMVSEPRVTCDNPECAFPIPRDARICPVCGQPQPEVKDIDKLDTDGDGIPDQFEIEQGMKPFDPADADDDKDNDQFTNLEEFNLKANKWLSNPSDPADYPSPIVKLRVAGIVDRPFVLRFQGVNELEDGVRIFLLNLRSLEQSYFAKLGEVVQGYEVTEFKEIITTNEAGQRLDRSTLTLKKGDELIVLIKNQARERHERTAKLVLLVDKSRHVKNIGDAITLKDKTYNVIDIRGDGVLIRDMQTGRDTLVPRLSESEKLRLRGGPEGALLQPGSSLPGGPRGEPSAIPGAESAFQDFR